MSLVSTLVSVLVFVLFAVVFIVAAWFVYTTYQRMDELTLDDR